MRVPSRRTTNKSLHDQTHHAHTRYKQCLHIHIFGEMTSVNVLFQYPPNAQVNNTHSAPPNTQALHTSRCTATLRHPRIVWNKSQQRSAWAREMGIHAPPQHTGCATQTVPPESDRGAALCCVGWCRTLFTPETRPAQSVQPQQTHAPHTIIPYRTKMLMITVNVILSVPVNGVRHTERPRDQLRRQLHRRGDEAVPYAPQCRYVHGQKQNPHPVNEPAVVAVQRVHCLQPPSQSYHAVQHSRAPPLPLRSP